MHVVKGILLTDEDIVSVAHELNMQPAQVLLTWASKLHLA